MAHTPHHSHGHGGRDASGMRLLFTLGLNFIIPTVQIIGGLAAGSMALISDAVHNYSDFVAVFIAYVAHRLGRKGATPRQTFGYRRAEILAALGNTALLLAVSAFILAESVKRLAHPEPVAGGIVVLIASLGIVGNGLSAWLLHRDSKDNLNLRGAFLHMFGDMLTSVAVAVSGLIILWRPWYWLDPLLSAAVSLFIAKSSWSILRQAVNVLMNAVPLHLDLLEIHAFLEGLEGVKGVHHLHAWSLCSSQAAFSCHVVVADQMVSQTAALTEEITRGLHETFAIEHVMVQFETTACGQGELLGCDLGQGPAGK